MIALKRSPTENSFGGEGHSSRPVRAISGGDRRLTVRSRKNVDMANVLHACVGLLPPRSHTPVVTQPLSVLPMPGSVWVGFSDGCGHVDRCTRILPPHHLRLFSTELII
ncbi:MAG: hypothetical protein AB4352_22120 [Hormoscilla sp.]